MGNSTRIASKRKLGNAKGCLESYMAHLEDIIIVYEIDHPEIAGALKELQIIALEICKATDKANDMI